MTQANKQILKNRALGFLWAGGGMLATFGLEFVTTNIGLLDLPVWAVGVIGLLVAQLTKYINVDLPKKNNGEEQ